MNFVSKEFGITKNVPLESKIKKNSENEISTSTSSTNEEEKLEEGTPFQNEEEKKE